jgi:hypothetical protein|tara:strand:+ start:3811 stop:4356 length:546 start_codon:yes stop_codon:yes gene_type:complete
MRYLIIVLVVILFLGCKAKIKTVNKEKTNTELIKKLETTTAENTTKTVDSTANTKTTSVIVKEGEYVDVVGDSTGVVTIEQVLTPKGNKLTFTGVKKVSIGKNKTKEVRDSKKTIEVSTTEEKEKTATELTEAVLTTETTKKNTDIKKIGFDPVIALGIGLGVVGLIIFLYIRRKKRLLIG